MTERVLMTGFASITACGVQAGLPAPDANARLQPITAWQSPGPRQAFLVPEFRPGDFAPGLRTRRMDRLSIWSIVASALALKHASVDCSAVDLDRAGVVCGSSLGCIDRTHEFLLAVADDPAKADPILFPETLSNMAAGHAARHFGLRGPNLTLVAGLISSEMALIEAASLLRAGSVDLMIVLAGDVLIRPVFEWYEAAGRLDPACRDTHPGDPSSRRWTRVPGEGLVACVLEAEESAARRRAPVLGRYLAGWNGTIGVEPSDDLRQTPVDGTCPFAVDGPALFACEGDQPDSSGGLAPHPACPGPLVGDVRAVAPPATIGAFGGSGLWMIGHALASVATSATGRYLVTSADACRGQGAAVMIGRGDVL